MVQGLVEPLLLVFVVEDRPQEKTQPKSFSTIGSMHADVDETRTVAAATRENFIVW